MTCTNWNHKSILLILLLNLFYYITHESATKQDSWLIQLVVLVAQRAHSASFQYQAWVVRDILPYPPARERSQDMAVSND